MLQHCETKGLIMFASDTQDVIKSLLDLVNDLSQRKKRLREKYFLQQRERFFIPNESGIFPKRHAAAAHASEVLRAWANEYSLPAGENNVLMKYMGSIARITTANDRALESVPIEAVTKEFLHAFFGSEGSTARKENNQNTTIPSNVQIPPTNMRVAHQMQGSLVQPTLPSAFRVPSALPAGFDQQMQMQSQYNCSGHPSANPPLVMDNAGYHQGNGGQPMPHPPKVPSMEAANAQTYGFQQPFPSFQQTNGGVLANSSFRINGPSNFAPAGCPPSFQQQMGGDPVFTMEPSMVSNRPNFTSTNRYQQQPQMAGQSYGNPHHQQFYNDNQPPPQMFPGHYQDQLDFQQAPPQAGSLLGSSRGMVSQQQWQQQQQLQYHQQRSAAPPRASQQNNYGRPPVLSNPKFHSRIRRFD